MYMYIWDSIDSTIEQKTRKYSQSANLRQFLKLIDGPVYTFTDVVILRPPVCDNKTEA